MTRQTLMWDLRAHADVPGIAREALGSGDAVEFLNSVHRDAWRSAEDRQRAADYLTRHLWPDDRGVQRATWIREYVRSVSKLDALKEQGLYEFPEDSEGEPLDGYHAGGVWFPHVPSADPLTCPDCGWNGDFWDWTEVDAGNAAEPDHACPSCGWDAPEGSVATE